MCLELLLKSLCSSTAVEQSCGNNVGVVAPLARGAEKRQTADKCRVAVADSLKILAAVAENRIAGADGTQAVLRAAA